MSSAALHPSERRANRARGGARAWVRLALIVLPVLAGVTVSARAALHAFAISAPVVTSPAPAAVALDPQNATASPAQGTTGTIALPPEPATLPIPTGFATSIVAAAPFRTAHASALDRGRALECLSTAIYYEAASESDDGQRAVAQVVLNRVRHPAFPATVCGVVYQGSERASGCQFSFACDGAMARVPARSGWARAVRVAAAALNGQVYAPVGLATHYHTFAVTPAWNRTLVMTDAVGAHFFHRWKGYWGTAAAFHQGYAGGEPVPGPHRPAAPFVVAPLATIAPVIAAAAPVLPAPTAVTQLQPAHATSGDARDGEDRLPDSPVLDRWKDSGQPIR